MGTFIKCDGVVYDEQSGINEAFRESLKHSLIIGGDFCPVPNNLQQLNNGDIEDVLGKDMLEIFNESAGLVCNLEAPVTDTENPICKSGPNLRAPSRIIESLQKMSLRCVGLANNHILDQGIDGVLDTVKTLEGVGIPAFGAGKNLATASESCTLSIDGLKIGFYACAEREFNYFDSTMPCANIFEEARCLGDIYELSQKCDRVIVLYHGMKEHYRYPSPNVVSRCRGMVDAGASLVLCQHSHCIGCFESYNQSAILYGQGDFCFPKGDELDSRRTGLLVSYDVLANDMSLMPLVNNGCEVRLASGEEAEEILRSFFLRSDEIRREGFIEEKWERFSETMLDSYAGQIVTALRPAFLVFILRVWWKLFSRDGRFAKGERVAPFLNVLQCEAHNEIVRTALEERLVC